MNSSILCFGEVLLRLSAPAGTRIANATSLSVHVGGAEANVGALLAQLGHHVEMLTVLPDSPIGDLCQAELRRTGLATGRSVRAEGRLGLYFFEPGAGVGAGRVVYDRKDSAFAAAADQFDWPALTAGARWFHLSGINLALGERAARSALAAVEAMHAAGVTISFDVNHRSSLWEGRSQDDFEMLRELVRKVAVLFAGPADISRILDTDLPGDTAEHRKLAAQAAFAAFDGLQIVASTQRSFEQRRQALSARMDTRDAGHDTAAVPLEAVVDRIGSGDAFAGAVIDGLLRAAPREECLRNGLAAAVMKHSLSGDRWIGTREQLETFDPFTAGDVRR
jgi:2-dehydro-3-deoxygluconokinase